MSTLLKIALAALMLVACGDETSGPDAAPLPLCSDLCPSTGPSRPWCNMDETWTCGPDGDVVCENLDKPCP